jgi:hypothetical protein
VPAEPSSFYFSDISVGSSIDLLELPRSFSHAKIQFRLESGSVRPINEADLIHDWLTPAGEIALSCFKSESGYLLRFPNSADFTVSPDGTSIRGYATGNTDTEIVRHDLVAQVLPRVLSHRGELVLHASAVSTPQGAVAFIGNTGTGKSTIAASFSSSGHSPVSDDCLVVDTAGEGPRVAPTFRGPRLWPDSAAVMVGPEDLSTLPSESGGKVSLPTITKAEWDHPGALRLKAAFVLHPKRDGSLGSPVLEELSPAQALMTFVEQSFQLDITHRPSQERRLELFSQLANQLPTYRLEYPQEYSCLDQVKQKILTLLAKRT